MGSCRLRYALALAVVCACSSSAATDVTSDGGAPDTDAGEGDDAYPVEIGDATLDVSVDVNDLDADAGDGDAGFDVMEAGFDAGPPPTVTVGASDRILLNGTVVTPDTAFVGQVLIEGALITCVAAATGCAAEPGATGATVIDTHGIIAPGLIDTHNHILFDIFDGDDWTPSQTYANHDEWTNEARYQAMLDVKQCLVNDSQGKPAWCASTTYGTPAGSLRCEIDKYGELKGLVAGTTSIVGLPGTSGGCFASLARSIDTSQNDLGQDKIQTSAIFPPSKSSADGVCDNFTATTTDAYLIHVGEGTDPKALAEFAKLGTVTTNAGCLYASQTTITHGTAFGPTEFSAMAAAGMKLTWSPASNVSLYGATTNIAAALDANVLVALAPDWSMGGSQNLLDEMRFADSWDDAHFGNRLGAQDLVKMTTTNAASVVGLPTKLGKVAVGYLADLMVVAPSSADAFASIVAARPKDVRMTMVGGVVLYGDAALKPAAPQLPGCEDVVICGASKFLCVAESSGASKLGQTYAQIKGAIETALGDVDALTPDGYDFAPLTPLVKCD